MAQRCLTNADGDFLIVPQTGISDTPHMHAMVLICACESCMRHICRLAPPVLISAFVAPLPELSRVIQNPPPPRPPPPPLQDLHEPSIQLWSRFGTCHHGGALYYENQAIIQISLVMTSSRCRSCQMQSCAGSLVPFSHIHAVALACVFSRNRHVDHVAGISLACDGLLR